MPADLDPAAFAFVMATGICSTALADVGQQVASAVLLALAAVGFAVLAALLAWRLARYPRRVLADLDAPQRTFGFFTLVAACVVLAVDLAADGYRTTGLVLAGAGGVVWVVLAYLVPARLILAPRGRPVLLGVNGSWFLWVVGTQSVAVAASTLDSRGVPLWALVAVAAWSVGVVLYLAVATLVLARLLLVPVRAGDLTAPYWIAMGATAITVLAAAQILAIAGAPAAVSATRTVIAGLGTALWAFGTWLIPWLTGFAVWRALRGRGGTGPRPAWWSAVFPLGMYATASVRFGSVARLPLVAGVGHVWAWVAAAAWLLVFAATVAPPLAGAVRRMRGTVRV